MAETRKADITLYSTIDNNESVIKNVLCRLYLPNKMADPIELHFSPTEKQAKTIEHLPFWKFSMKGKVTNLQKKVEKRIVADLVYSNKFETKYHSHNLREPYFIGEPADLTITHYLNPTSKKTKSKSKVEGRFWITPNELLQPAFISEHSYTGEVKITIARNFEFTLDNGLLLKFENYHKNYKNEFGDNVSFHELVASFELNGETNESPKLLDYLGQLDDVLLLASFAARRRSICLGWDSCDSKTYVKRYLRNRIIPKDINRKSSRYDLLIDLGSFPEFMETAYPKFRNYSDLDALRRTLSFVLLSYEDTFESSFMGLYSALEMIVLHFRKKNDLEFILPTKKFEKVRKEFKKIIENSALIVNSSSKLEMKKKLSELNRISFASAFDKFREFYSVDLSDLWSVNSNSDGISLSQIRNKLVHGEHFNKNQTVGLLYAREHLRWIIERMILAVLGWSIEKSNVNPTYLKMISPSVMNWRKELDNFK